MPPKDSRDADKKRALAKRPLQAALHESECSPTLAEHTVTRYVSRKSPMTKEYPKRKKKSLVCQAMLADPFIERQPADRRLDQKPINKILTHLSRAQPANIRARVFEGLERTLANVEDEVPLDEAS